MNRCFFLAGVCALLLAAGCQQNSAGSGGITYEDSETPAADSVEGDSQAESGDPVVSDVPGESSDDGGETTSGESGGTETTNDAVATDNSDAYAGPSDVVPAPPLSPEDEAAIANIAVPPLIPEGGPFFQVNGAKRLGFDNTLDLVHVLNMTYIPHNATTYFPQWLMDLDGDRVIIRGFMYNTYDGVTGFVHCRDTGVCCFGPNPRADYRIPVSLREGETTDYIDHIPFDVEGTFHIDLRIDELGKVYQVYCITDGTIIRL